MVLCECELQRWTELWRNWISSSIKKMFLILKSNILYIQIDAYIYRYIDIQIYRHIY